ncbi:iron-sulfur cluster biosynthesis family protein [Alkalicoccobacillus porphyridii]|uniref:Iron-sulfur cluster biosynthesis family protein n=1 Tax=Alkalicoccobacillus porphyridii TaxID=2597270 RepID=A0A553ZV39_9BACI|nr:iron-sulfur cluster biosynthesis family protein [Alkalicoccobacillus porphyridii]
MTVTEEAKHYLENKNIESIRVVARDTYECSTMIEFFLQEDTLDPEQDEEVVIGNLSFIYNKKASEEIGPQLTIDYKSTQGLKLTNNNQTLAYGLNLK